MPSEPSTRAFEHEGQMYEVKAIITPDRVQVGAYAGGKLAGRFIYSASPADAESIELMMDLAEIDVKAKNGMHP